MNTTEADDSALLADVRRGDADAMAELWARHYPAALTAARRITRQPKDAEEVASDAFAAMLQALQHDAGPSESVRAYLLTAVRNQAANRARRSSASDVMTDEIADFEDTDRAAADPVAHQAELGLVRVAFASLPRHWQTVLWRTAVDHDSNTQIAADLGKSPNAVAALSRRARLGFRTAYLQAHVSTHAVPRECAPYATHLADLLADSGQQQGPVGNTRKHVSQCESCTQRLADLEAVDRGLGAALLPAVLALGPGISWVTAAHATHAGGVLWLKTLVRPGHPRNLAIAGTAAAVAVAGACSAVALTNSGGSPSHRTVAAQAVSRADAGAGTAAGGSAAAHSPASGHHAAQQAGSSAAVASATSSPASTVSPTDIPPVPSTSTSPGATATRTSSPPVATSPPGTGPSPTSPPSSTGSPIPTSPPTTVPPSTRPPQPAPTPTPTPPPPTCLPLLCWVLPILGL